MSDKFRVAISGDFLRPDGSLAFPFVNLAPLTGDPRIEVAWLPYGRGRMASTEVQPADIAGFDAIILWTERFTRNSATAAGRFAFLRRFGAGYEKIDIPACTEAGIAFSASAEGVRRPVAVMLLTLMLAVTGKLLIKDRLVRAGPERWNDRNDHMGVGLVGRTLGLIGLGNTGAETVRLAKPLDMNFIAYDPYAEVENACSLGVRLVDLEDLFRESDVVAISCPLTEETHHLVNASRISLMKPTAFLINGARGPIVDQAALADALRAGRIAGAGLDVFEKEPPDPDDPILSLDNVILNPHALCWTDQCFADCFDEATDAVLAVMQGREPKVITNPEIRDNPAWRESRRSFRERFGAQSNVEPSPQPAAR